MKRVGLMRTVAGIAGCLVAVSVCAGGAAGRGEQGQGAAVEALPTHAVARFGRAPLHYGRWVGGVAFSPDSRQLATHAFRCRLNDVAVWDVATGRLVHALGGAEARLIDMTFLPGGRKLVTLDVQRAVQIWDLADGKPSPWPPDGAKARSSISSRLAVAPDGRSIAVAGGSAVEVYDVATGRLRYSLKGDRDCAFSPDGRHVAGMSTSSSTGGARLYDAATGKLVRRMVSGDGGRFVTPTFSADGKLLAGGCTGGADRGTTVIWQASTGEVVGKLAGIGYPFDKWLSFDPAGALLATATRTGGVRIWDVATGAAVRSLPVEGELFRSVAFSPNGKLLAAAGHLGQVHLWQTTTWKRIAGQAYRGPILSASASANGRRVLTAGQDGAAKLWDGRTGKLLLRLPAGSDGAAAVAVSRDGRSLYAASAGGKVRCRDAATGRLRREIAVPGGASGLIALVDEERKLAAFGAGGGVSLIDVATGEVRPIGRGGEKPGLSMALSADGRVAAVADRSAVSARELPSGRHIGTFAVPGNPTVYTMAMGPAGRLFAVDRSSTLELFELDSGKLARKIAAHRRFYPRHKKLAISRDGLLLAVAQGNARIAIWSVRTGRKLGERIGHRGGITALEFLPDRKHLLSGGTDGVAFLWELDDVIAAAGAERRAVRPADLPDLWRELADDDAARAHEAIFALIDAGDATAALLAEHLKPVTAPSTAEIGRWVAELNHNRFAVRQRASAALAALGPSSEPALRKALAESTDDEARARLTQLLAKFDEAGFRDADALRTLRAVDVLERLATPAAVAVLKKLASGSPQATLTRRAAAALKRLARAG